MNIDKSLQEVYDWKESLGKAFNGKNFDQIIDKMHKDTKDLVKRFKNKKGSASMVKARVA